jgi:hypothetical protein
MGQADCFRLNYCDGMPLTCVGPCTGAGFFVSRERVRLDTIRADTWLEKSVGDRECRIVALSLRQSARGHGSRAGFANPRLENPMCVHAVRKR